MAVQPLRGVRILDLTRLLPGPYATQLLGDLGAEVVKIEEPTVGDYYRDVEPRIDADSWIFAMLNRNKKSVALDLKDDRGVAAFFELVESADAVIEGFRPGVVERLGIDAETVREHNDSIVYCSLTGYGQTGPYEQRPGHDLNFVGIGGLLDMTGRSDGAPVIPGLPVADFAGGMATALSVMFGLFQSATTGEGSYYDLAMTDVVVSWMTLYAPFVFDEAAEPPERGGTLEAGKYPCYGVYETADGEHVTLAAMEYKFWEAVCRELGLERFENPDDHFPEGDRADEVRAALAERFAERTRTEWLDRIDPTEIPVAPVNDASEVWTDPQIDHRGMVTTMPTDDGPMPAVDTPIRPAGCEATVRSGHPERGEHSRDLLAELSLTEDELEALFADGVTTEP